MTRRMPLELKLPVLMSAVLAAVLSIALIATATTLRSSALDRARERLMRATRQIATVGASGIATQHARYAAIGNDSSIRRALRATSASEAEMRRARGALSRLSQPTDSGMPVELWTAEGRRVAYVGNDVRVRINPERGQPEMPERIAGSFETLPPTTDSLGLGPLYAEGGRVHFWFTLPIKDGRNTVGYITHQRRIAIGAQTQRTLRELSGDSVSLYYRNWDGSFWANASSGPIAALHVDDTAGGLAREANGESQLLHEERVGTTSLVVGMHVPMRTIFLRPNRTIQTLVSLSLALLLGGVLASWLIGRSVARPLGALTRAAGAVAGGNYEARVPETGDFEVRRLAASFNHMAEEIGASRSALEQQTSEAEAANSAKSEFLTTMSHELRTPLNAIGGYVELLAMELRGPVTSAQKRDLERIKASQQHLLGLISGVLDLARVEAGKVTYELVNVALDPFLADLDALIEPQAAAKSVTLEYVQGATDLAALADREKLRQILLNLLSNAVRHTPGGGRITLWAEQRLSRVVVVVDDTGPGIPADKREEIFEPFVQLDRSLTKSREGLGLGLAISRDLARGMSGDLVVESRDGPGARFVVTLPRGFVDPSRPVERTGEMRTVPG